MYVDATVCKAVAESGESKAMAHITKSQAVDLLWLRDVTKHLGLIIIKVVSERNLADMCQTASVIVSNHYLVAANGKRKQLKRCFLALGVYLRKFITDNLSSTKAIVQDIGPFGKFALLPDLEDQEALYTKKIIFYPSSAIAKATSWSPESQHKYPSAS